MRRHGDAVNSRSGTDGEGPVSPLPSLRWFEPTSRCPRVRVKAHVTGQAVEYELCVAGGMAFIRRTRGGAVQETAWVLYGEAERLWAFLLNHHDG